MLFAAKIFKKIGPGFITGASDDDPSGIATYSQAGSQFGYRMLWLSLFTTPMMMAVQEMCARIGLTSGRGLMGVLKRHTSRRVVWFLSLLLLVANTVNIGADLGAMAEATRLILPGSTWFYLGLIAAVVIVLEIKVSYRRYVNILRWLTLSLFAYVIASFFANVEWSQALLRTFVPDVDFSKATIFMIVAILGTTISPYLFFWQTSEEVEEEIASGKTTVASRVSATAAELRSMRRDVATGMLLSNVVMFFIIVTTAATLHQNGITTVTTAADAAEALRPLAGNASFFLFTLGILGTGLLAIPVLAGSASYAIAEVFGWREGLGNNFSKAKPFYLTMAAAVIVGMSMNAFGISPLTFLLVAAVVNGLVAPVLLWFIVRLADRPDVVGEHVSPPVVRWLGWSAFVLMSLAGGLLIIQSLAL